MRVWEHRTVWWKDGWGVSDVAGLPFGDTADFEAVEHLIALAQGHMDAARSNGLTTDGDQGQLASLFSVLQPGDPNFNIIEP
jgi:Alkyl sulfatase C-terminal